MKCRTGCLTLRQHKVTESLLLLFELTKAKHRRKNRFKSSATFL